MKGRRNGLQASRTDRGILDDAHGADTAFRPESFSSGGVTVAMACATAVILRGKRPLCRDPGVLCLLYTLHNQLDSDVHLPIFLRLIEL
jgi:hypothetical protein